MIRRRLKETLPLLRNLANIEGFVESLSTAQLAIAVERMAHGSYVCRAAELGDWSVVRAALVSAIRDGQSLDDFLPEEKRKTAGQ